MLRMGKGVNIPKFGFFTFLLPELNLAVFFFLFLYFLKNKRVLHSHKCMIKNIAKWLF